MVRRSLVLVCALALPSIGTFHGVGLAYAQSAGAVAQTAPAETPLTPADAKALLGDWAIAADSPQGPVTIFVTLKVEADKVVGEVSAEGMGDNRAAEVMKSGADVLIYYSFAYQGGMISTVLTLTPGSADELKASFDFSNGAMVMPGTATRKKAA